MDEANIVSVYRGSLYPDSTLELDSSKLLYKTQPFNNNKIVVLEASKLNIGSKNVNIPHIEINFEVKFSSDVKYNTEHTFMNNFSLDKKRRLFKSILKRRIEKQGLYKGYANDPGQFLRRNSQQKATYKKLEKLVGESAQMGDFPIPNNFSYDKDAYSYLTGPAKNTIYNFFNEKSPNFRDFTQIMEGNLAKNEILGYKITKSTFPVPSDFAVAGEIKTYEASIIKEVFILNDKNGNYNNKLSYIDTQIKPDTKYYYDVASIVLVHGTEYGVKIIRDPQKWGKLTDQASVVDKRSNIQDYAKSSNLPFYKNIPESLNDDYVLPYIVNSKVDYSIQIVPLGSTPSPKATIIDGPEKEKEISTSYKKIPPLAPAMTVYPFKGINDKVLMILEAVAGTITTTVTEKIKTKYAGTIIDEKSNTIKFDSNFIPITSFYIYRTTKKPTSYDDFPSKIHKIVDVNNPHIVDDITPNIKYYYYATAFNKDEVESPETAVISVEVVDEGGLVFLLTDPIVFEDEEKKLKRQRKKRIEFRNKLRISPAFLQAAPNPDNKSTFMGYIDKEPSKLGIDKSVFSSYEDAIIGPVSSMPSNHVVKPKFKFRVTSKKTRRRLDINLLFARRHLTELPSSGAEIVYEDPILASLDPDIFVKPGQEVAPGVTVKTGKEGTFSAKKAGSSTAETLYKKGPLDTSTLTGGGEPSSAGAFDPSISLSGGTSGEYSYKIITPAEKTDTGSGDEEGVGGSDKSDNTPPVSKEKTSDSDNGTSSDKSGDTSSDDTAGKSPDEVDPSDVGEIDLDMGY